VNGGEPKIEIFAPFGAAFELTKKILFQPFDLGKWCVIGFAAFLANLMGGGFSFQVPRGNRWPDHGDLRSCIDHIGVGWAIAIVIGILLFIAFFIVLTWVSARGRFMFVDCIVRNRGAIVQPWKEFRREGNSYFIFLVVATLLLIAFVVAMALLFLGLPLLIAHWSRPSSIVSALVFVAIVFPVILIFAMLMQFIVPIMYRKRCGAGRAFSTMISLFGQNLGSFVLYFLFSIVLWVAALFVMVAATCLTCCIAVIPYVGTVILLPIFVLLRSFSLLFLRQFGLDYDVWAEIPQIDPPSISPPVPPIPPPVPPLPS